MPHVTGRSIALFVTFDGVRPDRADLIGATLCLLGVGVTMYTR